MMLIGGIMTNLIDSLREISVKDLLATPSMAKTWPKWKPIINQEIGNVPNTTSVLNLGDKLAEIFKSTSISGRPQGGLKRGGVVWECFVAWYMNLCMIGENTVVVKMKKNLVPEPIRDSITVLYGSFPSNSESDLLAITFPNCKEYNKDLEKKEQTHKGIKTLMDNLAGHHFREYEVGIIQCKTNWNDNAQIPMLWDMVYHAKGFGVRNISVGQNNYSIDGLKKFTYSFVTVPSSKKDIRGPSCTPVNRVYSISGGNYWGSSSEKGVANSLKEIFRKNFSGGTKRSLRNNLSVELPKLMSKYSYFDLV